MEKVSPGQPVRISARETNTSIEVNEAWRRGQLGGARLTTSVGDSDSNRLLVKNNTGGNRERGDIVGLGEPLFLPSANLNEFLSQVVVSGETPSAAYIGRLAMLIEPIAQGKIGEAAIGGVWNTIIYVDHEEHEWATYVGNDQFRSEWYGDAQILWKEDGTGERRARLALGRSFWGPIDGVTAETIAPGGSGDVTIWDGDAGIAFDPPSIRNAHLIWTHGNQEIAAGTQVSLLYSRRYQKLVFRWVNCAAEE